MARGTQVLVTLALVALGVVATLGAGRPAPAAEKKPGATFEVYQDKAGEYRWRLRSQNAQILATASEGYKEKRSCLAAIESVKRVAADAPVQEQPAAGAGEAKPGPGK